MRAQFHPIHHIPPMQEDTQTTTPKTIQKKNTKLLKNPQSEHFFQRFSTALSISGSSMFPEAQPHWRWPPRSPRRRPRDSDPCRRWQWGSPNRWTSGRPTRRPPWVAGWTWRVDVDPLRGTTLGRWAKSADVKMWNSPGILTFLAFFIVFLRRTSGHWGQKKLKQCEGRASSTEKSRETGTMGENMRDRTVVRLSDWE